MGVVALMGCSGDDGGSAALETEDYTITVAGPDSTIPACLDGELIDVAGDVRNESATPHSYEITFEISNGIETVVREAQIATIEPGEVGDFYVVASFDEPGEASCEVTRVEQG